MHSSKEKIYLTFVCLVISGAVTRADNVLKETATGLSNGKTPGQLVGGNVNTRSNKLQSNLESMDLYAEMNLGVVRVALNPGSFWTGGINNPTPDPNDSTTQTIVDYAIGKGLEPYFLFNYRPVIHGGDWNDYTQQNWYDLGREFALEFQDRISIYTFINEPENHDALIDATDYATSLKSFADGVHSVSTDLKVSTGGFATIANVSKTADFMSAVGPLVNSGDLYALNIHTYNSLTNSARRIGDGTNNASPNAIFASQKILGGITVNIPYSSAEWNLRNTNEEKNDLAASEFLTAMWDHLGVVGDGGNNDHKTEFATVFQLRLDDTTKGHSLADSISPVWEGNERGDVFEIVMNLAHDAAFKEVRPIDDGYFILEKELEKKIWVLQNRTGWRDLGSTATTTVSDIPAWATELELWYWDGLSNTVTVPIGTNELSVDIRPEETVMIVAAGDILLGDYNFDRIVDSADYVVWLRSLGQTGPGLSADGNGDLIVDRADYDLWRANIGSTSNTRGMSPAPEPSSFYLAAILVVCGQLFGCRNPMAK